MVTGQEDSIKKRFGEPVREIPRNFKCRIEEYAALLRGLIKAIIYLTNPTRHRQHRVDPNHRPRHFQETLVSVATLQDPP